MGVGVGWGMGGGCVATVHTHTHTHTRTHTHTHTCTHIVGTAGKRGGECRLAVSLKMLLSAADRHCPGDVEDTVEKSHGIIGLGGAAVFQIQETLVAAVEIDEAEQCLALVPTIVNSVLNKHQVCVCVWGEGGGEGCGVAVVSVA